jgi:hypothetical protein
MGIKFKMAPTNTYIRNITMRANLVILTLLLVTFLALDSHAQTMPLVYGVENTGANFPPPQFLPFNSLPVITSLPDPFQWADSTTRIRYRSDWIRRRAEIGAEIEHYEIGEKPPRPDTVQASYTSADSVLRVTVIVGGDTLKLTSKVIPPSGPGPYAAIIGMNSPSGSIPSSFFVNRNIARIPFYHDQVTTYSNPFTGAQPSNSDPYFRLYPNLNLTSIGQYSAWAWGVSRIIDGLELVQDSLPIDLKHIAVTGCSYAGKMALFAGAFDERIALTLALESGGGGATSWRYSQSELNGSVEKIDNTDYNWFMDAMKQFSGDNVSKLPEDHHELMAMCAPRALYVTANPDYTWLSNPSCDICSRACQRVYNCLRIGNRFGYSIIGGHPHCQVPDLQITEIGMFVDKFLLGKDSINTNYVVDTPYGDTLNASLWITFSPATIPDSTTTYVNSEKVIGRFDLQQNYPNPFNPATTIMYSVGHSSHVELKVYNSLGQMIRTLVNDFKTSGNYSIIWDGRDNSGRMVPSGTYFYTFKTGNFVSAKKMIYLK